ncbi:DMT family transporter [Lysinibacillus sp. NPDC097231]|uniref:DMT family transporter n=1 Tax=Lysinibacillus sp. NPDC097231 TaxID=3364142 RepID=UPI0038043B0B
MFLAYIIMCLIYGTTFLGITLGLHAGFSPFLYAGLRFSTAGILILAFLFLTKVKFPRDKTFYLSAAFIGLCMTGIEFSGFYWAQQYVPSSFAALLGAATPLMVILSNLIFEKEKLGLIEAFGVGLGFLGVLFIVYPNIKEGFELSNFQFLGSIAIIVSTFFYGVGTVKSKKILIKGYSATLLNGFQMLFGSLFLFTLSFLIEDHSLKGFNITGLSALLYLIIFGSIIASGIYYWLVKVAGPVLPSTWTYVSPMIALLVGYLFLKESVYTISFVGSIIVLCGVFLTNYKTFSNLLLSKRESKKV